MSISKQSFQSQSGFSQQQQTWYSGMMTNQEVVTMSQATMSQAQKTISGVSVSLYI